MTGNSESVRRLYEAFARNDAEGIRRTLDPDVEWVQCAGFPGGGRHLGVEAVMAGVFGKFPREWESFGAVAEEYLECGDTVVVLGRYVGTHRRTRKAVDVVFAHTVTLRGGRIVRFRQVTDTHPIHRAMAD
jgi:ketosteroid isomerase-like protein